MNAVIETSGADARWSLAQACRLSCSRVAELLQG